MRERIGNVDENPTAWLVSTLIDRKSPTLITTIITTTTITTITTIITTTPITISLVSIVTHYYPTGVAIPSVHLPSIPHLPQTWSISGLVHNPDVASNSTSQPAGSPFTFSSLRKSTVSAVKKIVSRSHSDEGKKKVTPRVWQILWELLIVFLLVVGVVLVLCALTRLAMLVGSQFKQKLRERRERRQRRKDEEAMKWNLLMQRAARVSNNTHHSSPTPPISNNDFFTTPEDMGIGFASAPPSGVVDDEISERGRPHTRFQNHDLRNPRPGLASSPTADQRKKREASQTPCRDSSEEKTSDAVNLSATAKRHWRILHNQGSSSSSSQWQQQWTANSTTATTAEHAESIPMDNLVPARPKAVTPENEDEQEILQSTSRRHHFSEYTVCEERFIFACECDDRRSEGAHGTFDRSHEFLSRDDCDVADSHRTICNPDDYAPFRSLYP
ncbi:hypothetical protein MMC07_001855 [Pseudocyphellaria aurata]|nr:hypothetical protein [Pseudocyphellaria aurata]